MAKKMVTEDCRKDARWPVKRGPARAPAPTSKVAGTQERPVHTAGPTTQIVNLWEVWTRACPCRGRRPRRPARLVLPPCGVPRYGMRINYRDVYPTIRKVVNTLIFQSISFLVAAALLPPALLLFIIYRMDRLDREPLSLLLSLFFRGVVAMVPILVLELLADQFIDFFPWSYLAYLFLAYFVVPGFIEEGIKYRVLIRRCWREPNFNYRFDAIVYAVFVSLGFAAVENVMYVLTNGFATAVARAIFSIPGHAMFGIVMGAGVGQAKWLENLGQRQVALATRKHAFFLAAVLHGLYDFLLVGFGGIFYVYFVILVVYVVRLLRRCAREDGPVVGNGQTGGW